MFLVDAGQEARRIDKGHQRDIEAVAHAHEARHLIGCVDIDHARHNTRLLRDDAHAVPADARQSDDGVAGPQRLELDERALVDHLLDHSCML